MSRTITPAPPNSPAARAAVRLPRRTAVPFAGVLTLLASLLFSLLPTSVAHAADTFQYWGFHQLKGTTWAASMKGAAQVTPADGSVDGWRFAIVAGTSPRTPRAVLTFDAICKDTPATSGQKRVGVVVDFGRAVDAPSGVTAPAPFATCVQTATTSTSAQVLAAAVQVRENAGMVCGLNGYPATGCGDKVAAVPAGAAAADQAVTIPVTANPAAASSPSPTAGSTDSSAGSSTGSSSAPSSASSPSTAAATAQNSTSKYSGSSAGTWITALLILAALAAAAYFTLRRRGAQHVR